MKTNKNVRFPADSSIWRCAGPCQLWGEHPDVAAPGPSGSSGEVQKQSRGRQQLEGRGPHIGGGPRQALHPLPKGGLGLGWGHILLGQQHPGALGTLLQPYTNAPQLCAKPEESLGSVPTPASTSPRCLGMSRAALRDLSQALSSNPTRAEPAVPCQGAEQRLFRPSCPPLGCSVPAAFTDPWPRCQSCSPSPSRQLMGAPQKGAVGVQRGHTQPPRAVPAEVSCWEQTGSPGDTAHGVGTGTAPRSKKRGLRYPLTAPGGCRALGSRLGDRSQPPAVPSPPRATGIPSRAPLLEVPFGVPPPCPASP